MGIGEHTQKALDTESGAALQKQGLCSSCKHKGSCDCTTCDCGASMHQHSKSISTDDLLMKWAADVYPQTSITVDDDGYEIISKEAEVPESESAEAPEGLDEESHETGDQAATEEVVAESTEGGQESEPETPETAPADEEQADPPVEKAASFKPEEVAELVKQTGVLVKEIGRLRDVIAEKDAQIEKVEQASMAVQQEAVLAKQVIDTVMQQPLRAKTAGYVEEFKQTSTLWAPDVADFLTKRSKLNHE